MTPGFLADVDTTGSHCATCTCFDGPLTVADVRKRKKKRSGGGIKRTSKDAKWSDAVRERAGWQCQFINRVGEPIKEYRCERSIENGLDKRGLHAAHCYGRRCSLCTTGSSKPHYCARLDLDDGLAMCWPHHTEIDSDRALKHAIFRWWLGDERFDALASRAHAKRNRDVKP